MYAIKTFHHATFLTYKHNFSFFSCIENCDRKRRSQSLQMLLSAVCTSECYTRLGHGFFSWSLYNVSEEFNDLQDELYILENIETSVYIVTIFVGVI